MPAQLSEGDLIENALILLEIVTVVVIAVLVGLIFRSPVAPLVPLAGAGIAYLITRHVLGWGSHLLGLQIPSQLAPIVIVLILGVVTDYSVFTLTGMRARLAAGERRTEALRHSSSRVVPLVIAAALTVAAGTVALVGANLDFFHVVGPGNGRRGDHLRARVDLIRAGAGWRSGQGRLLAEPAAPPAVIHRDVRPSAGWPNAAREAHQQAVGRRSHSARQRRRAACRRIGTCTCAPRDQRHQWSSFHQ